jgi:hypothetical protein
MRHRHAVSRQSDPLTVVGRDVRSDVQFEAAVDAEPRTCPD